MTWEKKNSFTQLNRRNDYGKQINKPIKLNKMLFLGNAYLTFVILIVELHQKNTNTEVIAKRLYLQNNIQYTIRVQGPYAVKPRSIL